MYVEQSSGFLPESENARLATNCKQLYSGVMGHARPLFKNVEMHDTRTRECVSPYTETNLDGKLRKPEKCCRHWLLLGHGFVVNRVLIAKACRHATEVSP